MESAPGLQDVFPTDTSTSGISPSGIADTDEITDMASFTDSLAPSQRPQMSEYNQIAVDFADTGFRFGDVRGISRADMDAFIESLSTEQLALAENQFKDQGGCCRT